MTPTIEEAFRSISNSDATRYVDYWDGMAARTDHQLFQKFLFAFMSVHTTWESNVNGYIAIKDIGPSTKREGLRTKIVQAGVGLHNNRSKWIDSFSQEYWGDPGKFKKGARESWAVYRSRLEGSITGLGPAKVSFALELAYPLEAEVLCLDVHMLRAYGKKDQNLRKGEYELYEADWVGRSRAVELPPFVVKQIYWDNVQGRSDSRYWSHVLE